MSQLNVVTVLNPLDPSNSTIERWDIDGSKSMAELFPAVTVAVARPMAYTLNGDVIDRQFMPDVYPMPGDWVVVSQQPGGDDAKSILRIVAMIVVAIYAPQFGSLMGGFMGGAGVMGIGAMGWTAILSIGGAMLVNALLPPPKPPAFEERDNGSATYGIDGAKNTSAEGIPTPLIYGKFRYGGNIIANHVVNDGNTQILYMLINCGEGPIASITNVEINDQPIENFDQATHETLVGAADQQPMAWFPDTIVPQTVNIKTQDTSYITRSTTAVVDRVRLDFAANLFRLDAEGNYGVSGVTLNIDYRPVGGSTWLPLPISNDLTGYNEVAVYNIVTTVRYFGENEIPEYTTGPYSPTGFETRSGDQIISPQGEVVGYYTRVPISAAPGVFPITNASRSTARRSAYSAVLPPDEYEIRVKRTTPESTVDDNIDQVFWTDLNEIINDNVGYTNTALLGIRIKLSDQLNGLPTVTHLNGGKLVKVWNEGIQEFDYIASANPAWIALDILTDARYAGGCRMSRVDLRRWIEWAEFCDDQGLEFHGVFDTQTNVWDAMTTVMRAGRAQVVQVGTRYSVAIERDEAPVQMFSVANMVAGTFKEQWLPMADRANEVEFTFSDKEDKYRQRTIRVADTAAAALGRQPRSSSVSMHGVVDAQRAFNEAWLILRMNRYIRRTVEFSAPMDAVACTVGSIILVQHDMPAWGVGGRLETGSTISQLVLDRPVTMTAPKTYQAMVHYDAMQRFSGTITSVTGRSILLGSYTGATNVKRLKVGTIDVEVESVYQAGANFGVIVKDATGITASAAYTLWDTNVLETRNVLHNEGESTTIILTAPLPSAPAQFSKWLFGETNKVSKPFRVKSISGSTEYRRDIVAIEHNPSVYDLAGTVPDLNYSTLEPVNSGVALPVTISEVYEFQTRVASIVQTRVTVAYRSAQPAYLTSDVFVQRNGGQFVYAGSGQSEVTVDATDADVLVFRIYAKDRFGHTSAPTTGSPFTVIGKAAPPKNVTGFVATYESFGVRLKWNAVTDADLDFYEIRYGGTSWETASLLDKVKSLEYFWKLQTAGSITARIKARDTSGNYSAAETTTTIEVQAPSAPIVAHQIVGGTDELLTWNIPSSMAVIDRYEIRHGADWASGTFVDTTKATGYRRKVDYAGGRTYWVAAIDAAGNVGAAGSVSPNITVPGQVTNQRAEVIDNNVLFYWNPPATGTLSVDRYEVRKGSTWAGGAVIGSNGNSTFGTVFEQASGTYTYWIAAYDSAGNIGTPVAITATVSQPPDYVLRNNIDSTFAGTLTNVIVDNGRLIGPVNTSQDWATHFTANSWTTPQAQVDAGLPIYIQPGVASGSYEEIYDLGAVIPTTIVTVTAATTAISGTVTLACQIYYKALIGDSWIAASAGFSSLVTNMRYMRIVLSLSCAAGPNILAINTLNIKIANKLKTDSGVFTITVANDGVFVPFGVEFIDADLPLCQPAGSTPLIPVVDFTDAPFPDGFTVYLYNTSGSKVTGSGSWTARGY
jgi:predicted phage tail protein